MAVTAGGGGGGGSTGGGGGGFGGGNGQISSGGGGGGLGAGGDVFVQTGALLTIEGGTLDGGTASGGDQGQGTAGQGLGGGIFIQGGANGQTQDLSFAPIAGQTLTINDVIADEPGSPSGGTATAGAGGLLLNGAGKVVLDADNTFTGGITVDSGTLELAASGAAGSGTITLGDPLLVFDAAYLPSGGTESANPIAGFGGSDEIDLVGLHYVTGATASLNGTTLTVTSNNVTDTLTLTGLSSGTKFQAISDGNTTPGTMVEEQMPCFCRGTLIMTPAGEVPVEALRVGDRVTTLAGAVRPITWFGRGRSSVTSVDKGACPIIVRRDALSEGVPNADLYLTAGHALFIEGVLVPVGCLVNDRSILRDERPQVVEFYHVELAGQDVLLANGTPAESYRDEGNRIRFQNADRSQNRAEEITPYAPVWDSGERVARVALRLRQRAGIADLTDDPDLHLLLDGGRLDPVRVAGAVHHFRLPRMPADLRIASRRSVPVAVGIGADARSLGVALRRVVLRPADGAVEIGYDAAGLRHGFHRAEPEGGLRWTDGEGVVPEAAYRGLAGPCELELHLAAVSRYPVAAAQQGQTRP
ncbi:MAG: Hint domain-containing protein [Alphaproteobacteria bacterium]|nr:Hint domain-containing protein [Alphaproteobacteria bacterium]